MERWNFSAVRNGNYRIVKNRHLYTGVTMFTLIFRPKLEVEISLVIGIKYYVLLVFKTLFIEYSIPSYRGPRWVTGAHF